MNLNNEGNLNENCSNVIFARNQENRMEKKTTNKQKTQREKRSNKKDRNQDINMWQKNHLL